MSTRPSRYSVTDEMLPDAKFIPLSEIGTPEGIEVIPPDKALEAAELEAFMNEPVKIRMYHSSSSGTLPIELVSVNGVNQPIIRGVEQVIKRKYVEALAQARIFGYTQVQNNPADLSDITMVERSTLAYPFEVLEDRNPRGREWLERIIMSE